MANYSSLVWIPPPLEGGGGMIEILFERTWNGKLSIPGSIPPLEGGGVGDLSNCKKSSIIITLI